MRLSWTLFLLIGLLPACNKESAEPALLFDKSHGCKQFDLKSTGEDGHGQDCLYYTYSDKELKIKHVNAGFNCCPEGFVVNLKVSGDTLVIIERENSNLCDCNCLFDLEYTLTGISKDKWWVLVDEEYVHGEMEPMLFQVDLRKEPEGKWCVERTRYPWREFIDN
ncbi:MAG: hypothetical protein R6V75_09905 [Bacteroidales bacterium]